LEAAAVGDERSLAVHEGVKPTGRFNYVGPRVQQQVVGVAELELLALCIESQ
jgi:hypothetical protein